MQKYLKITNSRSVIYLKTFISMNIFAKTIIYLIGKPGDFRSKAIYFHFSFVLKDMLT